eukprot:s597_g29.t3
MRVPSAVIGAVQPFSAEEDAEDDRSEPVTSAEKTPLKSCLQNSGSRTPEAQSQREITPPSSKELEPSKERQLKSALKQPTSSPSDTPAPTNILEVQQNLDPAAPGDRDHKVEVPRGEHQAVEQQAVEQQAEPPVQSARASSGVPEANGPKESSAVEVFYMEDENQIEPFEEESIESDGEVEHFLPNTEVLAPAAQEEKTHEMNGANESAAQAFTDGHIEASKPTDTEEDLLTRLGAMEPCLSSSSHAASSRSHPLNRLPRAVPESIVFSPAAFKFGAVGFITASHFSRKHWRFIAHTARNGRRSKTIVEPKPARPGASKEAEVTNERPLSKEDTKKAVRWTPAVKGAGEKGRGAVKEVLEKISWSVHQGQKVGLIGPNGCGKSTQLLMLMDQIEPGGGRIMKYPSNMKIAYMQQEADLDNTKTASED